MKRWTNGRPDATKRRGAMMALRGLFRCQHRMRADTHDGPPLRERKGISRRDLGRPMWITPSVCGDGTRVMCGTTSFPLK